MHWLSFVGLNIHAVGIAGHAGICADTPKVALKFIAQFYVPKCRKAPLVWPVGFSGPVWVLILVIQGDTLLWFALRMNKRLILGICISKGLLSYKNFWFDKKNQKCMKGYRIREAHMVLASLRVAKMVTRILVLFVCIWSTLDRRQIRCRDGRQYSTDTRL